MQCRAATVNRGVTGFFENSKRAETLSQIEFMNTNLRTQPKWGNELRVRFLGGVGEIKSFRPESNTWTYAVEMEMGSEPDFGRIDAETTILLYEEDILETAC